jgi:hypothetical protein
MMDRKHREEQSKGPGIRYTFPKHVLSQVLVAHAYNLSYSGGLRFKGK